MAIIYPLLTPYPNNYSLLCLVCMASSLLLYCLTVWCEFSRRYLLSIIYEGYLYSVDLCLQNSLETFWVRLSKAQNDKRACNLKHPQ